MHINPEVKNKRRGFQALGNHLLILLLLSGRLMDSGHRDTSQLDEGW